MTQIKFSTDYEVLTSEGFKPFYGIKKTKNTGLKIVTTGGSIQVTENHKFYNNKPAKDLKPGDILDGKTILEIEKIDTLDDYYDLLEVQDGHHYTTSGFESMNCAFISNENWKEFEDSIFPSMSGLAWKKSIIISTANGLNHFFEIVQKAKNAKPGSGIAFEETAWDEVPRYDSAGKLIPPEVFKEKIIARHGRVYFEQNYGNSFIGSSETLLAPETLQSFIKKEPQETWAGMLRVYEEPKDGRVYVMGVDASKDGKDAFAVQVLDVTEFPFVQVASGDIQTNYLEMPGHLYDWGAMYNSALIVVENNEGAGQSVADSLSTVHEYPNMFYQNGKQFPGFRTTAKSRMEILKLLQVLADAGKINIQDGKTIEELLRFELKNGKFQATGDAHDDLVMSLAMCIVPMKDIENFENFSNFLSALKTDKPVSTSDFFVFDTMAFVDS